MQRRHCECISCTAASPNAKAKKQNHEFKNLIRVHAPISSRTSALPVSVKVRFFPDNKQKTSCSKSEQSSVLPKTSQDINQQTTSEEYKDKARTLPQTPEHSIPSKLFVIWRFSEFRGVSVYVKRPSMNLHNHFEAYVNFSNNILRQRFHSLDMLHDKTTVFVLSLVLSCNLYDFLYHKTSSDQLLH